MKTYMRIASPLGSLLLVADDAALTEIRFEDGCRGQAVDGWKECSDRPVMKAACRQLREYFAGRRKVFDLALAPAGTPFQRRVWATLQHIAYGETRSYGDIARRIGRPKAARAVGAANGANPLPIVIPCHRVIGSDGSLAGYGGGLARKRRLLALEGARLPLKQDRGGTVASPGGFSLN